MGYIGDYVHARAKKYREFGIGRSRRMGLSFNAAYNKAKNELKGYIANSKDFSTDKDLEDILDTSGTKKLTKYDDNFINLMEQYFDKHYPDFAKKTFKTLQSEFEVKKVAFSNKNTVRYQARTIAKFREAIVNLYKQVTSSSTLKDADKKRIKTQLAKLRQQMIAVARETDSKIKLDQYKSIFQAFNALSMGIAPPTQKEKGDFAEVINYYLLAKAAGKSEDVVNKIVEQELLTPSDKNQHLVGGKGSQLSISKLSGGLVDAKAFRDEIGKSSWTVKASEDGKYDILYSTNSVQDTIDIQVEWGPGEDIRASVKNYSGFFAATHGITLIKETPTTLLFNLINTDFVNHYLNLLVLGNERIPEEVGNFKGANEIMTKALLVRALSGARGTGNAQTNTFIFNDNDTGKVKVVSVGFLMEKLMKLEDMAPYVTAENLLEKLDNTWVGDHNVLSNDNAKKRITNLLIKAHKAKLKMSLSPKVFEDQFKNS